MKFRRRIIAGFSCALVCMSCSAWSYSFSQTIPATPRPIGNSELPLLHTITQPSPTVSRSNLSSQQNIIRAIKQARTASDITTILQICNAPHVHGPFSNLIELESLNINVTAAALRRVAHIAVCDSIDDQVSDHSHHVRRDLLSQLLQSVGCKLSFAHQFISSTATTATTTSTTITTTSSTQPTDSNELSQSSNADDPHALPDVLQALAIMCRKSPSSRSSLQPMGRLVVALLSNSSKQSIHSLGPTRLIQCLQGCFVLQLIDDDPRVQLLLNNIFTRLVKPDAVSRLTANTLSHGLTVMVQTTNIQKEEGSKDYRYLLSRSFMRRMRKKKVHYNASVSDLTRALTSIRRLVQSQDDDLSTDLEEEIGLFAFATIKAILQIRERRDITISAGTVSEILRAMAVLEPSGLMRRDASLIDDIMTAWQDDSLNGPTAPNLWHISKILTAMEILHITDHPEVLRSAGNQLLAMTAIETKHLVHPYAVSSTLRAMVLLHRNNATVVEPYLQATRQLFIDEDFLQTCKAPELANFLWAISMIRRYDDKILSSLANRILQDDVVDGCTPRFASRILGTFTWILDAREKQWIGSLDTDPYDLQDLSWSLFDRLGKLLLCSDLTPTEVSSSLYSLTKASYVDGIEVFQHLMSLLTTMLDDCTSRQLAQCLWSCGKMTEWENTMQIDPIYRENALLVAKTLSSRDKEMAPRDLAQATWATGKLRITHARVVCSLAFRAKEMAASLNAIEVTNCLWGLSKVSFNDREVAKTLIDRLLSTYATPQDAATAMYALGSMGFKNEDAFSRLSDIMIDQIDGASAQAIANALWAHRAVGISPPHELLDTWAYQKLGLVVVHSTSASSE